MKAHIQAAVGGCRKKKHRVVDLVVGRRHGCIEVS